MTPLGRSNAVRRHRNALALAAMLALLALPGTSGAASNRGQYVEAVEPICERATLANEDTLDGVEAMIRRGETRRPARRLQRAAAALAAAVKQLITVPRPPADVSRLARWLGYARSGEALLRDMAWAVSREKRSALQVMAERLLREVKRANATVVGFEFDYCRINPARFV